MREIKFRAWDKVNKKMLDRVLVGCNQDNMSYVCNLVWVEEKKDWLHFDEFCGEIMQYTGMTDRNRKEIYDGDIVKDIDNGKIFEVFWNNIGCGTWWFATRDKDGSRCHARRIDLDDLEVIGNIYEHPHLLAMEDKA